ncbi:MAG: O-antigen ligase family protein [Acidimicrobiales bacterium]
MSPVTTDVSTSESATRPVLNILLHGAVIAAIVAVAAKTGIDLADGTSRSEVVLPVGALILAAMAALAFVRFEMFVVVVLVARASLDYAKVTARSSSGLDPASGIAAVFMVAAVVWLVRRRRGGRLVPSSALGRAMFAFFIAGLASAAASSRVGVSLLECARIAAVLTMLVVLENLLTGNRYRRHLLAAAFISAVLPLTLAAYQASSGKGIFEAGGFSRIRGTFLHPNPFAIYLALLIVMGAALVPHVAGRTRLALVTLLAAASGGLFLTYTRTAWIAALAGLLVVGALQSRSLIIGLLIGAAVVVVAVPSVVSRFSDLGQERHLSGTPGNSLIWRFEYWGQALSLGGGNPATGIGLKMTQLQTDEGKEPHNDFIRVYVEMGVIGLGAYLALLAGLARTARRAVATARRGFDRGIAVGFAGCVVTFLLVSIVSNVISQVVILWYFFAFAAAAAAVIRRPRIGADGQPRPLAAPVPHGG